MQPTIIVIIGGVAGGASAATRARRANEHADIILFEKDEHVSFANCGLPYYIGGEIDERGKLLVASPQLLRERFRIDVRTRQEVTAIDRQRKTLRVFNHATGQSEEQRYDKLVLSPGAAPVVPPMPGVDAANVFTLRNLADADRIKSAVTREGGVRHVTVIGAGFIGLEMVEQLVATGVKVTLVELQPQVLPLFDPEMAQPLEADMRRAGVEVIVGDSVRQFECGGSHVTAVELMSGTRFETNAVVVGIGVRPNTRLALDAGLVIGASGGIATNDVMQTNDPDIYAVGDAAEYPYGPTSSRMRVALAGPANRAGRIAGEHAATGRAASMKPVLGTSIVRVFAQTAAMTGLTERLAKRLKIPHESVIVHGRHHAGYYPGAQPISIKLLFAPDTGKVLGAQIIGQEAVDKRIDVIATAMSFGATVRDLAGLDLAYAPPFGSAKDPIHMAGFVASNRLDGLVRFVGPGDDLDGYQVIDVRTPAEFAKEPLAHASHAINVPLDSLRERLSELDASQPTVVVCASGVRSYAAARILQQNGFADVRSVSGGAKSRADAVAAARRTKPAFV